MQRSAVWILTFLITMPAFADARLPIVNVAAGSVSARSAFGEPMPVATVAKPEIAKSESKKTVVARNAKKTESVVKPAVDTGAQIASNEILSPRRPSSDLWAHNDTPLRMPNANEFSVISANYDLPEESIDGAPVRASVPVMASVAPVVPVAQPMSEIDAQIARLNELQRRAEESITRTATPAAPKKVVSRSELLARNTKSEPAKPVVASKTTTAPEKNESVSLHRLVVPMDDVIVRAVEKSESPRITAVRNEMSQMSPTELRKAFHKTFLSENKHLSTYQIDDRFDVASEIATTNEGFTAHRDLSESGGIRPLEIKIKFRNEDAALSRDNYNLLTEYASIVLSNPTRVIQVSIPERMTTDSDNRKLAARRLAIVEQVLRDSGISEYRILPVLSQRDEEGFVLRMISSDQYETLTKQRRDMFGDTISKKTYKSMSW